jgi:hypothetical protein
MLDISAILLQDFSREEGKKDCTIVLYDAAESRLERRKMEERGTGAKCTHFEISWRV